jgi:hypothetical protein
MWLSGIRTFSCLEAPGGYNDQDDVVPCREASAVFFLVLERIEE